jgi:hypothetical protein
MYEPGQTLDLNAMRRALQLLDRALRQHEPLLHALPAGDGAAAAFRRSVELLRQEADRLRLLVRD